MGGRYSHIGGRHFHMKGRWLQCYYITSNKRTTVKSTVLDAHMFPTTQTAIANRLDQERNEDDE